MSGADAWKSLAMDVPSLSERERAVLLIAYNMGDVWAKDDMASAAASLYANGYLRLIYSGGLSGECYSMPKELRKEIKGNSKAIKAMNEAIGIIKLWGGEVLPK